jgi:2'-5' RNA ligase
VRLFVAVEVPSVAVDEIRIGTAEAPAHLTVLFLGEVPLERAPLVGERFADAVRARGPFRLELSGMGMFPTEEHPRVIWIGVGAGSSELKLLQGDLAGASRELQLPTETRAFVPHLTLRRVRGPKDVELGREWVGRYRTATFGDTLVTELLLKESLLGGGPVVHRTVARLPLEGATRPP